MTPDIQPQGWRAVERAGQLGNSCPLQKDHLLLLSLTVPSSLSDVAGTNRKAGVAEMGVCPESDGVSGSLLKCRCLWETHRMSQLPRACFLKHSPQGVSVCS